jgi:SSS family solute:Na+ symporter
MVANAPEGLYQLLQQLNGIFFIPVASIMLAGFFTKTISAAGAKAALLVGMLFYVLTTFIFQVDIHFVHIWGIEFLLNIAVMYGVSYFYPVNKTYANEEMKYGNLIPWKYTKAMSLALVIITISIYIILGNV